MKISASYLAIKENFNENIIKLDNSNIDYIHMDIMDGNFVLNKTKEVNELYEALKNTKSKKDIHLMVNDVIKYVDMYEVFNPEFITFHVETNSIIDSINYIKNKGIKVGLAINPNTPVNALYDYIDKIDLVLVMSVIPGKGGQKFIEDSINKINELVEYRNKNNLNYLISVDGGINNETIKLVNTDISVIGSFITNYEDYNNQINLCKNPF